MADAARPTFFYDYSSVYAYLAACRLDAVLPVAPDWHPVWLPAAIDKFMQRGSLLAQRGGAVAAAAGKLVPYSREIIDRLFARGQDITAPETIAAAAAAVGLDGEETVRRCSDQDVKGRVKQLTQDAIERGVPGVPTVQVGSELFWGDDRLEEAAAALRA